MHQMVDVARINQSIALQKVNNESIDILDTRSMDEPASAHIRFGNDDIPVDSNPKN